MLVPSVQASYCYSYTVNHHYSLFVEDGGVFVQRTIKDANEISYASEEKVRLKGVTDKGFRVISDDGGAILFVADGAYYLMSRDLLLTQKKQSN